MKIKGVRILWKGPYTEVRVSTHLHKPVVQVILPLTPPSGVLAIAVWRTGTPRVRKLVIQTPKRQTDLSQVGSQAVLQQPMCEAHLAQPVKAELAELPVLHHAAISLADGLYLLASDKIYSFLLWFRLC